MPRSMSATVTTRVDRYELKGTSRVTSVTWKVRTSYIPSVWNCWPTAKASEKVPPASRPARRVTTRRRMTVDSDTMREEAVFHR